MVGRNWQRWLSRTVKVLKCSTLRRPPEARNVHLGIEGLEDRIAPATISLSPSADNTLYQSTTGQLSNGAGIHFYVGETNENTNALRRGAIKFNLSAIPAGSIITSATLQLRMSKTVAGAQTVSLHRALANWGEGTSNAGNQGGKGAQATTNDATWIFSSFNSQRWNTAGGDLVATASASTSVGGVGNYTWSGANFVADLQQWLDNPSTNFGWIVRGNETSRRTAKQFDTKEISVAANRPVLTVNYTLPAPDLVIAKRHVGNFRQGDAAATYTITVGNIGAGPTTGAVTIQDTLPLGLTPTPANDGVINGWTVSTSGQTVTATRSDALASGNSYPSLPLTVSVAIDAPGSVVNTATVSGGGQTNTANDSSNDPTTIVQLPDLTLTKSHLGRFRQGDAAATYTLSVQNLGPGPTVGVVTIMDTLPSSLSPTSANTRTINGWTVDVSGQTVVATRSDVLEGGGSYPALDIVVSVANDAPQAVTNAATVSGGGDASPGNNSAADQTVIDLAPDLSISKTHIGDFRQGEVGRTYALTVTNVGMAATSGIVTVVDNLPEGLIPTAANSGLINGWNVSFLGQTITATRNDPLASGEHYGELFVTVDVSATAAPTVTNSAIVSGGGNINPSNDRVDDPTIIVQFADLAISKRHDGDLHPGDPNTAYTIRVSNVGLAATDGTDIVVKDVFPTALIPLATNSGARDGWTITVDQQTVTAIRSDPLNIGSSYPSLVIFVRVANDAPSTVTNTATVSGGGDVNAANNSASDTASTIPISDLAIAKTHVGDFRQGDPADTYSIVVSNVGTAPTLGEVIVTDTLPVGLTPVATNDGDNGGWNVSITGQVVTATRNDALAMGGSYPALIVTVRVANNAPAELTNVATVSGGGQLNSANDSIVDPTKIIQAADLKVDVSHVGNFRQGDAAAKYAISVSNVGSGPTAGIVTVTDVLPVGLTPTAANNGIINGWTVVVVGQTVRATRVDSLAAGGSYPTFTLLVNVAKDAPGGVVNSANVSGGGQVNRDNDSDTDATTITPVADLVVHLTHVGNFRQGETSGAFKWTVTNLGAGPTVGAVTLRTTLPVGLSPVVASNGVMNGWTVVLSGQTIVATRTDALASGASYPTLTLTVRVAANAPAKLKIPVAISGGGEIETGNNTAFDVATILPGILIRRRRGR